MGTSSSRQPSGTRRSGLRAGACSAAAAAALAVGLVASAQAHPLTSGSGHGTPASPVLSGRAVLPVATFAGPPASGAYYVPGPGTVNGITFPLAEQPVEGFSAVVPGRHHGEYLAMPDNGFGTKANSRDFLIRAYYVTPHFRTARGGTGTVDVGDHISFRDPDHVIGFPIVNEGTTDRLLTGGDIDPESVQRGKHGDLWVGDEFGPWILHFDKTGRLLEAPYSLPGGLMSPNNPHLADPAKFTQPNSRGLEAMGISKNRRYLYAALEGPTVADTDKQLRRVFEFDTRAREFTGREWHYRTDIPDYLVSDMVVLDRHRVAVIERDAGRGDSVVFRGVYEVNLRRTGTAGFVPKRQLVDLTEIPDPALISLPPIHEGDVKLGDPFAVVCESVEAVQLVGPHRLLVGCDNNFPNTGRNPALPDDNEFITVDVPGLTGHH